MIPLLPLLALLLTGAAQAAPPPRDAVTVPAGPFSMGCSRDDAHCDADEGPPGGVRVFVPAFAIDRHEVTVADYAACVAAGQCSRPKDHRRNRYCNFGAPGRERHPVNCVDWAQAQQYCRWVGGRLPYEAEWEKAARAGTTTPYPWGRDVTCRQAILDDGVTTGSAGDEHDGCGEDRTWPVGSRPPNPLGLHDMHGNAGEWTANWYARDALTARYARRDLKGPETGRRKVVRGGSWDEDRPHLRSSFRNVKAPESGTAVYGSIGFRCAYDLRPPGNPRPAR